MTLLYQRPISARLFNASNVALVELVAWGFSQVEASRLLGFSINSGNASRRVGSAKNALRIASLKQASPETREWAYAFAAMVLNDWPAVKAWERLGKGKGFADAARRQQASRALRSNRVLLAMLTLQRSILLPDRLATFWGKHELQARDYWNKLNALRCYGPSKRKPAPKLQPMPKKCGAKTRAGGTCQCKPIPGKRRCKFHGGLSTGPKTQEGKARCAEGLRRWASAKAA